MLASPLHPSTPFEPRRFVLLDRDGTINRERHYLSDPDQLELCPNAGPGLRRMLELGLGLIVVTNQSGIARGYFNEARLREIHERLRQMLRIEGVLLHGIYACPHAPDEACPCRKPGTALAERAAADFGFDLSECFMIGDKACDIELGQAVNASTLLVRTGYGSKSEADTTAQHVVDDLLEASRVIERALRQETSVPKPKGHPVMQRLWSA